MVRDKSRLPFEVIRDERKQLKQEREPEEGQMKRIEVFASPEKNYAPFW
jgi:hypothetical protein